MTFLKAIFLGFVQGITEFLPVSSSGHLAICKHLLNMQLDTGILFDCLLHFATLIAICIVFHKDVFGMIVEFFKMIGDIFHNLFELIKTKDKSKRDYRKVVGSPYRKLVLMILVSSVPTAIIGFAAKDLVETLEETLLFPGIFLIITAIILFVADRIKDGNKSIKEATYPDSLIIGVAQGIATMPGISRSGTTLLACMLCKFERNFAVKYAFLVSLPAVAGATLLELIKLDASTVTGHDVGCFIVGMLVAGIVGFVCIKVMLMIVRKKKFLYFSIYCLLVGTVSLIGYFLM